MTDRKLLELAAKAAGIDLPKPSPWFAYTDREGFVWLNMDGSNVEKQWNPLTNDGDALRLAVKLRLCVDNCVGEEGDREDVTVGNEIGRAHSVFADEFHGNDHYAATRRAIVRAAAEIGRNMK